MFNKSFKSLFVLLVFSSLCPATTQIQDKIIYEDIEYIGGYHEYPLEDYWSKKHPRPEWLSMTSTACWRGYIATWEVRNESLFLKSLGRRDLPNNEERPIPLQSIFPDTNGPVLADWYSGVLDCNRGLNHKEILFFSFHKGKVLGTRRTTWEQLDNPTNQDLSWSSLLPTNERTETTPSSRWELQSNQWNDGDSMFSRDGPMWSWNSFKLRGIYFPGGKLWTAPNGVHFTLRVPDSIKSPMTVKPIEVTAKYINPRHLAVSDMKVLPIGSAIQHSRNKVKRTVEAGLELIRVSEDGRCFLGAESGERFFAWGFNYDHDDSGRLIEDYWYQEWPTVVEDFKEMKTLGANVVRIHPQVAKFMKTAKEPNEAALKQLVRMVRLAEETGVYLDITGLGCYHKEDVPKWYDALDETGRWEVQALFWEAISKNCAECPAVFCYDLMNEPILPGEEKKESEWLMGEFGGKYFVQRISLDLAGRMRKQVVKMWVNKLRAAIRKHDKHHMITVGVIPWAHTFPNARPLFYSKEVGENLDFVSVHFYPKKGEVQKALTALAVYDVGKPLVIEETSPLYCGEEEFDVFVDKSHDIVDGYIGFYWGKTIEEYSVPNVDIAGAIMRNWLEYFRTKGPEILGARSSQ